jgi:protein TonB
MAMQDNSHPNSPNNEHEDSIHIAVIFEERHIWTELYESLREAFIPASLPPLELTSTPVPVPDRMAGKPNPWAFGSSTVVNGGILAIVILMGIKAAMNPGPRPVPSTPVDLNQFNLIAPASAESAHGGGGGGTNALTDPVTGRPPRFEENPLTPPQVPLLAQPLIAVQPAVSVPPNIRLPENQSMPILGVQSTTRIMMASNGQGGPAGIGTGKNDGVGPGNGKGDGPGSDRGINGGIYTPGIGGVSNPVPLFTPEAEFSDEARRAKFQGVCVISVIVDSRGYPQDPRVLQPLGMGLDEKALEAVRKYRFKPAKKDGKPVPVRITVEVDFRLF